MTYFKTIFLIIYFIFLCINSQKIYCVSTVSGVSGMKIRAGYGYLGRSSEVEANSEIELEICEKSSKKKCEYFTKNAFGYWGYISGISKYSEQFLTEASILEKIREQLFEYLSIQMAALDKSYFGKIPKCLIGNKKAKKINNDINKLTKKWRSLAPSSIKSQINKKKKEKPRRYYYGIYDQLLMSSSHYYSLKNKKFKNKIISIDDFLSPRKIAEATLTYEYFKRAFLNSCMPLKNKTYKSFCIDLKSKLDRIKSSFPILTTGNLLPSIASIIGSDYVSGNNKANAINRGYKIIDQYLPPANRLNFPSLFGGPNAIYNKAILNTLKGKTKEYEEKRNSLFNKIIKMKKKLKKRFQSDLKRICQSSFLSILKNYPAVVRQMYLDLQDENEKNNLRKYLCRNRFMQYLKNKMINSCDGVSGNIDGPDGLIIKKSQFDFPYESEVFYRIKKDKNSGFIIELPRRYNFVYDPTIDPSHQDFDKRTSVSIQRGLIQQERKFIEKIKSWKKKIEEFFNNASKDNIPPLTFKVVDSKIAKPINVSACFNSGIVPENYSSSRINWSGDVLRSAVTPGQYRCGTMNSYKLDDWEDVSNYTTETRDVVIFHENCHKLNIDDSYNSYKLPAGLIGEVDDVLTSPRRAFKLYPRDIKRIIFPALNCVD